MGWEPNIAVSSFAVCVGGLRGDADELAVALELECFLPTRAFRVFLRRWGKRLTCCCGSQPRGVSIAHDVLTVAVVGAEKVNHGLLCRWSSFSAGRKGSETVMSLTQA